MAVYSSRYARAFSQVVLATRLDSQLAQQQLADFAATLEHSRDLREVLMNPSIPQDQKVRILDAVAAKIGMFPQVRNFVAVIVEHQRLGALREILDEYNVVADAESGMVEAEITSALVLNEDDRRELEAQVARMAGGHVRAKYVQDPTLLGGAVVKIGSTVYDGSLRAQLAALRQQLAGAQAV